MSYPVISNPVTRERGIVRRTPSEEHPALIADLYAAPGAAVVGEHVHPHSTECFTVVRGELRMRLNGEEQAVEPGRRVVIPPNTPHDWWNAGSETAYVILEIDPGRRFEARIRNLFGLTLSRSRGPGGPGWVAIRTAGARRDVAGRPRVRGVIGALDRLGQVSAPAGHRVLTGVYPDLDRDATDADVASPSPAVSAGCTGQGRQIRSRGAPR
jgi:quercetin dioxygenase-like cupin family protein